MEEDGTISQHPSFLHIQRLSHSVYTAELQMVRNNTLTRDEEWMILCSSFCCQDDNYTHHVYGAGVVRDKAGVGTWLSFIRWKRKKTIGHVGRLH